MDPVLIGFVVYLAVVLVAGTLTYRLTKTQEDFLLAGRRLNVWVATFSERASGESVWLLLGLPAATPSVLGSGCVLHLRPAGFVTLLSLVDAGSGWTLRLPLPNAPVLDDLQFVVQQVSGPSTNSLGFELGDALRLTLGTF